MRITNKRKIKYDTRFSQEDISQLSTAYCPATVANRYDKRFNGYEIINLFKLGCMPKKVNAYNKKFSAEEISLFCWTGCRPERVNEYNIRVTGYEIYNLIKNGYRPEILNEYNKRFNKEEILNFLSRFVKPKIINKYDKRFNAEEILHLIEIGCRPEIANGYDRRFNAKDISNFFLRTQQSSETIDEYDNGFNSEEIDYIDSFIESHIFYQCNIDTDDIPMLYKAGCSPQEVKEYNPRFNGLEIAVLYKMDLKPDKISNEKQEKLFKLFRKMVGLSKEKEKNFKKFKFLGTGISGVVLLKGNNACKFSEKIKEEYKLLKKIHDYHKGNQVNIIKLKNEPKENIALEIEYIQGSSLENILQKKIPKLNHNPRVILRKPFILSKNKIIKYGSDIINGLVEMRQAGIFYHRDIRPANILIDEKDDKAIIIDFGVATTDKKAIPQDNRRYGGINDLVSLGQIMYKMATGQHIFAKSKSMERTTYAQGIKDYRDKVYSDKTGKLLDEHIEQVDKEIKDEQLRMLIKACLTAKNYHYKKIRRMMAKLIPNNGQ